MPRTRTACAAAAFAWILLPGCETARRARLEREMAEARAVTVPPEGELRPEARTHHAHLLMLHGARGALAGARLVALAELAPESDLVELSREHGRRMMRSGRDVLDRGVRYAETVEEEGVHPELIIYTADLQSALVDLFGALDRLELRREAAGSVDALRHAEVLIAHALEMAGEGSTFIMLGKYDLHDDIAQYAVDHGRRMGASARELLEELRASRSGGAAEGELFQAVSAVIALLEDMPSARM